MTARRSRNSTSHEAFDRLPHLSLRRWIIRRLRDPSGSSRVRREFDAKLADVVGLYLDPPERALVLCVDEKSQIQALDRIQPLLPLYPGLPA